MLFLFKDGKSLVWVSICGNTFSCGNIMFRIAKQLNIRLYQTDLFSKLPGLSIHTLPLNFEKIARKASCLNRKLYNYYINIYMW